MSAFLQDRLLRILIVLLAITLASWLFATSQQVDARTLGVTILALAFIKVRLIVLHYMEAARANRLVRIAFEAWVFLVAAITIGLYLQ